MQKSGSTCSCSPHVMYSPGAMEVVPGVWMGANDSWYGSRVVSDLSELFSCSS